jgi:DNA-directed RNA polymerase subunit RPC12/RpoP
MKVKTGEKMGSYQCVGCLKHFRSDQLWRLPYAGSRCTECALRFLNFYKEHATRGILNILNRELQVTKKTAVEESSKCSIEEPSKCSSCG